jgi:integrase
MVTNIQNEIDRAVVAKKRDPKPRRTGQVVPRGEKKWQIRIYLGADPNTGKRNYYNKTFHGGKKEAERWLAGALTRLAHNEPLDESDESLGAYLQRWLEDVAKQRIRERSLETYQFIIDHYIKPALGNKQLGMIKPAEIQSMFASLAKKGISASTLALVRAVLSGAFKQALRWQMIRLNPMTMIDPPKRKKPPIKALTAEQARNFLYELASDPNYLPLAFALGTGVRPGERSGVMWSDIDWRAGTVRIERSLVWHRNGVEWYLSDPKTDGSKRTIPLPAGLLRQLKEWQEIQTEMRKDAGADWHEHGIVFTDAIGEPVQQHALRKSLLGALERANLPAMKPYALRHSCATILLEAGVNVKSIAERLGHTTVKTTLDKYAHVTMAMQEEATQTLENAVFSSVRTLLAPKSGQTEEAALQ